MLQIRVRTVSDNGTVTAASRVLDTANVTYTAPFSASATLEFSVSRADFVPTQMPFLVAVEYAVNGGEFVRVPTEDLFVVEQDSDDSKDLGQIVTYQAQAFVPWLLAGAYVGTGPGEKDGERQFGEDFDGNATAGLILSYLIGESKGRGWLPSLALDFDQVHDSAGAAWQVADRAGIAWRLETFYTDVLEQLTSQGLCEWRTTSNIIQLYRSGTAGADRTEEVVLGGQDFERVPVKTDMTGWFTHVIALSDAGRVHVQNTAAETRFGRRSIAMTQSGVKDVPTSTKLANELLTDGLKTKREESYRWTPESDQVMPWKDFNTGDMITAMSRGGALERRVIGIMVTQGEGVIAEVEVKVGEKISSLAARTRKKIDSVSVGGVAGGSGDAFPSSPGPSPLNPAKPAGLRIINNTGEWSSGGITALSNVGLEWDPVTQDTEGSEITIPEYEVWSRLPSSTTSFDTATNTNSVEVTNWRPGEERLVSVRARSQSGAWSEWSNELSVTPAMPSSIVPAAPAKPVVVSNVGSFTPAGPVAAVTLTIPAVTLSTDGEPVEVAEYELWNADGPLFRLPASPAKVTIPSDVVRIYRVRAGTAQGVWGDLSPSLTVTGAKPAVEVRNPTAPILTSGAGNAFARWDGMYTSGGAAGAHRVDVEARIGTGAWIVQGTLIGAGQQILKLGSIGDVIAVRLRAYDQIGRPTGTSTEATITVVGIEIPDFDQSVSDMLADMETDISAALGAANGAQSTANTAATTATNAASAAAAAAGIANSKGKTIIQNAAPDAADRLVQNLWIDTTGGANTPKRWSGTAWVAVTDKAATDAAAAAVTAKSAADDAQTRADSAFTAATNAATAAGQAQTTANGKNRVWYSNTEPPGTGHKIDDVWFDGANGNRINTWSGSAWVARQMGTNAIANLAITNALIANLDAAKITTGFIAATRIAALSISTEKLAANAVTAEKILADEAFFNKVFANVLMAGRIEVDHVSPNFGDSLSLSANSSIVLQAGRLDDLSNDLAGVADDLSSTDAKATSAEYAAIAAASAAAIADGKAVVAQIQAQEASDGLAQQQAVFVVIPTGAEVRAVDASSVTRIEPEEISMLQGGVKLFRVKDSQVIANEIVTNRAQLANHVFEKFGSDRTVIRAL